MSKVSLIISFYNKIDNLRLLFAGFENQSFKDFEIIIADDGSDNNIVTELEKEIIKSGLKISQVWQEDTGFRKNRILNKAILAASSDFLIFIDGDCIPHPEFVLEHYKSKTEGFCYTGRRVNLSEKLSNKIFYDYFRTGKLKNISGTLILDGLFGNSFDVEKGIYFRNKFFRKKVNQKYRGILGCNFSVHKSDLLSINGFDERYEAPSIGEDSDIQFRLEKNGVRIGSLNNMAVQYHLFHKLQPRPQENLDLFENIKKLGKSFTPYGIIKTI